MRGKYAGLKFHSHVDSENPRQLHDRRPPQSWPESLVFGQHRVRVQQVEKFGFGQQSSLTDAKLFADGHVELVDALSVRAAGWVQGNAHDRLCQVWDDRAIDAVVLLQRVVTVGWSVR